MIRATLSDVRSEVARVCGTSGMSVTDPRVLVRINDAQQELMNEGNFPGVVDRWHLIATNGRIILPPQLDMLLEFTEAGTPATIRSPWAEFVAYGPGPAEDLIRGGRTWYGCDGGSLFDRGEVCTRVAIPPLTTGSGCVCDEDTKPGPWQLRFYADPTTNDEVTATIQGLDANGLVIRTEVALANGSGMEWINGEQIQISSGSGFTETTKYFTDVTAVTMPVTNGYKRLVAWNGIEEIELSNYAPWETTPSYHAYYSPYLESARESTNPCCKVVLARARRRFVPVAEPTDVLIISNILALKAMIIAQWKREAGNMEEYVSQKLTAVDIMRKEATAYRGKVRAPALTMGRGFSLGYLPAIR